MNLYSIILKNKKFVCPALILIIAFAMIPALASDTVSAETNISLNSTSNCNNVRISERDLPFNLAIAECQDNWASVEVEMFAQNYASTLIKDTITGEEVFCRNGIYILAVERLYYGSIAFEQEDADYYYSFNFEVTAQHDVHYAEIVKNVVKATEKLKNQLLPMSFEQVSENEPANNSVSGATLTHSNTDNIGAIGSSGDVDWWKIKFNFSGTANFWLGNIPSGCDYKLEIYNTPGTSRLRVSNNSGNIAELISLTVIKDVYYTVKISSVSNYSVSSYLLRIKNYPNLTGNEVYKISSIAYPTKLISVESGYNANAQNVMMSNLISETSSGFINNQRFRLNYDLQNDAYTIAPICSYNGWWRVLDVYNTGTIQNNANVQTWEFNEADEQYFTIEESEQGCVIRLKYFTDYVLTASTSNVFVSSFNSTAGTQQWILTLDIDYNSMESLYKSYGWGWMYPSNNSPTNLHLSSSYGKRYYAGSDEAHFGIDIPAANGTVVKAVASGAVTQRGYKDGIERFAVVETEDSVFGDNDIKIKILYQHMDSDSLISLNANVTQGQTVIGKTGQGHMHLCVITDGGNRLNAPDFQEINSNTPWYTQNFINTTNALLFFSREEYNFTFN